ncbi:MAG: outer membrane protein assembly factor BamD (BamD/ComL family) [Bacteroidia bacterium]|jgi:outer membrane protein assembly factor BamD (BamD/ComL family)
MPGSLYVGHVKHWKLLNHMKIYLSSFAIFLLLFTGCGNPKIELQDKIDALILSKTQSAETKASIAELQTQFIEAFPEDSMSQAYLENVSFYYLLVDSTALAKKYANQYVEQYPTSENASDIKLIVGKADMKEKNYKAAIANLESVQNEKMLSVSDMRLLAEAHLALVSDSTAEGADLHYFKYAALLEQTVGIEASIDAYSKFKQMFPNSDYGPSAMMLYADKIERTGDAGRAVKALEDLIEQYPESEQAGTARVMLQKNLVGLTAEQQLGIILRDKSSN